MTKIKSITFRRVFILSITVFLLIQSLSIFVASENTNKSVQNENVEIKEMVCRIRNISTGLYLDSYRYALKTKAKSYAEYYSESSLGQVFHLSACDDGTYMIIPQNDNAEYTYVYSKDITTDNKIKNQKCISR